MGSDIEKRMLLAILLSVLIYVLYGLFVTKTPPPLPTSTPQQLTVEEKTAPQTEGSKIATPEAPNPTATNFVPRRGKEIEIEVESSLYRALVSNEGGTLKSWKLKNYKSDSGEGAYEMVAQYLPPPAGSLFGVDTGDERLNQEVNLSTYEFKSSDNERFQGTRGAPTNLTLTYERSGLSVNKTFMFNEGSYLIDVGAKVILNGRELPIKIIIGPSMGNSIPKKENTKIIPETVLKQNGKVVRIPHDKIEAEKPYSNVKGFAGLETHYFATVFLPHEDKDVIVKKYNWTGSNINDLPLVELNTGQRPVSAYVGPKDYQALAKIDPSLTELINYGTFAFIVKAFLFILKALYSIVHNYGVAIIFFTLIITLALFPLRYKQMVSMKKMQKLQPRIKAIQDKYKSLKVDARQKQEMMQKEIMELHRQHGVNPLETLGGCLLLLPQLPIFYAFYNLLAYSIELRNAPFAFWIKDLSDKDPYYVTPVLMGVSMLLQYKLTPTATGTDPAQQTQAKIMGLVLPVFLTFIFLNLSSGLNLYFLFSNLFGILLQKVSEQWVPKDGPVESQQVTTSSVKK